MSLLSLQNLAKHHEGQFTATLNLHAVNFQNFPMNLHSKWGLCLRVRGDGNFYFKR